MTQALFSTYSSNARRCWLFSSLIALLFTVVGLAHAQPSPPAPPHPADATATDVTAPSFDPEAVLTAAQAYLPDLKVTELYVFAGGKKKDARGELRALLGVADQPFARLTLDPRTFEPVPLGLEGFLPPAAKPPAEAASTLLADIVPGELSLSSVVVPEPEGYKLLLVYEGRAVGEMKLGLDLLPKPQTKWLEEAERSR